MLFTAGNKMVVSIVAWSVGGSLLVVNELECDNTRSIRFNLDTLNYFWPMSQAAPNQHLLETVLPAVASNVA